MKNLKVSTAQFEHKSGDIDYNLSVIESIAAKASAEGSDVIAFHECSITGYTFARHLTRDQLTEIAELIPEGETIARLQNISRKNNIVVLAGLFERNASGGLYKSYVCVGKDGLIAKHRKLHPFIHPDLIPGDSYTVFDLFGWRCGILICYDNNIIENVRATVFLGASIIFMPHVTMCTPSPRPGSGFVNPKLWQNKDKDPHTLRKEFDGPKGREWIMKWLPSRAHDNGIYVVFSNPVGMDDDQLKNGCSMIIDPYGDILAECRSLGNEYVTAELTPEKIEGSGGGRYIMARRPDLYRDIIGKDHTAVQKVAWMKDEKRKTD